MPRPSGQPEPLGHGNQHIHAGQKQLATDVTPSASG
jgi:hypothetical protein